MLASGSSSEERSYTVKWHGYSLHLDSSLNRLRLNQDLCDVALKAPGGELAAHKAILCACSAFFGQVFMKQEDRSTNHISSINFIGISLKQLSSMLDFMYEGEAKVLEPDLNEFFALAKKMKVRGLINTEDPSYSASLYGHNPEMAISHGPKGAVTVKITLDEPNDTNAVLDEEEDELICMDYDNTEDNDRDFDDRVLGSVLNGGRDSVPLTALPNGKFRCEECSKVFAHRKYARVHARRIHLLQLKFQCLICQSILKDKYVFRVHVYKTHHIQGKGVLEQYGVALPP